MEQTLLLNATYEPLKVVHWQKAVTLWCQGKVEIIAHHDREVRAVSFSFKLPSVIRLLRYVRIKKRFDYVPFSRANIYARDEFKCQYCADVFPTQELTFDHVIPVSQGGRKDWENIVTCCVSCNRRKGGRTPEEARMRLIRPPRRPMSAPAIRITIGLRSAPESWRDYLYWNLELDEDDELDGSLVPVLTSLEPVRVVEGGRLWLRGDGFPQPESTSGPRDHRRRAGAHGVCRAGSHGGGRAAGPRRRRDAGQGGVGAGRHALRARRHPARDRPSSSRQPGVRRRRQSLRDLQRLARAGSHRLDLPSHRAMARASRSCTGSSIPRRWCSVPTASSMCRAASKAASIASSTMAAMR